MYIYVYILPQARLRRHDLETTLGYGTIKWMNKVDRATLETIWQMDAIQFRTFIETKVLHTQKLALELDAFLATWENRPMSGYRFARLPDSRAVFLETWQSPQHFRLRCILFRLWSMVK